MIKIDERFFEDILFDALKTEDGTQSLQSRGLDFQEYAVTKVYRQLNLKEYGIPDIIRIGFYKQYFSVEVIELKVTEFNVSHLLQLGRYLTGINRIINESDTLKKRCGNVFGKLIVAGFDNSNEYLWMDKILDYSISVYSADYGLDGIKFKKVLPMGWYKKDASIEMSDYIDPGSLLDAFKTSYKHIASEPPF